MAYNNLIRTTVGPIMAYNNLIRTTVGADLSCPSPIYRPHHLHARPRTTLSYTPRPLVS
jgi:hypothetical protein